MSDSTPSTAFYVTSDSRHFLGLVALVNSLRLLGHDHPIYVGDCGLDPAQCEVLEGQVTLVDTEGASTPHLAKTIAPLRHPADVMVLVDADIIVTRSLDSLIDEARLGKVVAFADRIPKRFEEEWSHLLGLGELRPQRYVNSGLLIAEREVGCRLLRQLAEGCEQIDIDRSVIGNGTPDYPFYYLDQDVLNALLATYESEILGVHDYRLAPFPPFAGLRVADGTSLRCSYGDGVEPFALHHIARKPWMASTRWNIYSHLLVRLLLEPDVAVPLRRHQLPLRLRTGKVAWVEKRRSDAVAIVWSMRGRLGLRRKLALRASELTGRMTRGG